eukprot:349975_1
MCSVNVPLSIIIVIYLAMMVSSQDVCNRFSGSPQICLGTDNEATCCWCPWAEGHCAIHESTDDCFRDMVCKFVPQTTATPTTPVPTTNNPTTNNPTTSIPTTINPTTSIPTTSIPTTINPTTVSPTTNNPTPVPTTNNPTTNNPTTKSPTTSIPT